MLKGKEKRYDEAGPGIGSSSWSSDTGREAAEHPVGSEATFLLGREAASTFRSIVQTFIQPGRRRKKLRKSDFVEW
ncbi:hypothetical protein B9G55_11230 [Saccharibacillus sp. O16]|nr:hypothetical protein B9G55_11230 [Saccharibacillus sp. O16]